MGIDLLRLPRPEDLRPSNAANTPAPSSDAGAGPPREGSVPSPESEDISERFVLDIQKYAQQYSHLYFARLMGLREAVVSAAKKKWGVRMMDPSKDGSTESVTDGGLKGKANKTGDSDQSYFPLMPSLSRARENTRCCLVGSLYKSMELKPSVLKSVTTAELSLEHPLRKYAENKDVLFLEDHTARIQLEGVLGEHVEESSAIAASPIRTGSSHAVATEPAIRPSAEDSARRNRLVTGMIVAVIGYKKQGAFIASEWTLATIPTPLYSSVHRADDSSSPKRLGKVCFISDLCFGHPSLCYTALERLEAFLMGSDASPALQALSRDISRVVLLGNTLACFKQPEDKEARDAADVFICRIGQCRPVDIVPGHDDPTNYALPQQPLHPCLFPLSRRLKTVRSVTNPYDFTLGKARRLLGHSGQPLANFMAFSSEEDDLEGFVCCIEANHLAPTAPDTLECYPYVESDPFRIDAKRGEEIIGAPDIYFSGGHAKNQSKLVTTEYSPDESPRMRETASALCVCVASFLKLPSCSIVDLQTLEVDTIEFD